MDLELFEDDHYLHGLITSEKLTLAQISQLRAAWQAEHDEVLKYKESCRQLQIKLEAFSSQLFLKSEQNELETVKSSISLLTSSYPGKPFVLLKELSHMLPQLSPNSGTDSFILSCAIKTGDSYQLMSSCSAADEVLSFESSVFDDYLRSKAVFSSSSEAVSESMSALLPKHVCDYLRSGSVSLFRNAVSDESQTAGHNSLDFLRRNDDILVIRSVGNDSEGSSFVNRCTWLIHSNGVSSSNTISNNSNYGSGEAKENLFGSTAYAERYGHNLVASSGADTPYRSGATHVTHSQQSEQPNSTVRELTSLMFSNRNINSSSNNNSNSAYWMALLAYSSQLMLTSLVQYFEHRDSSVTLLQYQAAEYLSALLFPLTVTEEKRVHVNSHNVNNSHSSGVFGGAATTKSDVRAVWAEVPRVMETLVDGRMLRGHGVLVESDGAAEATSQCEVYLTNSFAHNSHRHASAQDIVLISSQQTVTQIDTTESSNSHTSRLVSNGAHSHSTVTDSHINDAIQRALRTGKTATVTYSTNSSESSTAGYSYQQRQTKRVPEVSNTTIIAVPFRDTSGGRDSSGAALTCVIVCSVSTNQAHLTAATVTQIDTILSGTVQPLLNRWLVSVKHSVLNLFPLFASGAIVSRSDETAGSDVVAASVSDDLYSLLADQVTATAAAGLSSYVSYSQLVRSLTTKLECDWVVVACTDLSSSNNSGIISGAITIVNNEGEVLSPSVGAAQLSPTLRELLSSFAGHTLSVADLEQALSLHGSHGAAAQCVVAMDAALKHQLYTISSGGGGISGENHHLISLTVTAGSDHHARDASVAGRYEQFLAENYRITVIGGRLWRPFLTQSAGVLASSLQSCFDSAVQRLSLEECRRVAAAQETDRRLQSEVLQLVTDLGCTLSAAEIKSHTAEEGEETVADDENMQAEPRILLHQAVSSFVLDLHDLQKQQRLHNAQYHNRHDSAAAEDVESFAGSKIVGVDLLVVSSDSGTAGDRAFLLDTAQNQWVPLVLAARYNGSGPNSRNTTPNHSNNNSRSSSPVRGRTISSDSGHVLGKTVSTSASRSGRKKKTAAATVPEQQYEEPLVKEEWLEIFADSGNDNSENDSGIKEKSSSRVLFSADERDNASDNDEDEYGTPVQRARLGRRSAPAVTKGDSSGGDNGVSVKVYVRIQHSVSLVNSDVAGNENETTDLWRPILSKYVALHKESLFVDHNAAGSVATPHTKSDSETHSHSVVAEDSLIQSIVSHAVRRSLATTPLGAVRMGTNYLHDPTVLNSLYAELPVLSNYILIPVGRVHQQQSASGESYLNLLVTNTNSDNTTVLPTRLTKYLRSVHMRGQHSVFTALPNDTATSVYNYLITLNDASVDSNGCELSCVLQPVQSTAVPTRAGSRRDVQQHNQQQYHRVQQEELLVSCLDTTAPIYLFCGSSGTSNSSNAQEDVFMHYLVVPRKDTLKSPYSVSRLQDNLHSVFSANQLVRSSGLVSLLDCAAGIERLVAVSAQDATEMSGAQSLVAFNGKPQHSSAISSKDGDINSISCVESSARILSACAGVIADVINHHSNDNGNNNDSSSVCLGVSTYILPMHDNDSSSSSSGSADDSDILELGRCDLINKRNNTVSSAGSQLGAERLYCSSSAQLISKLYDPTDILSSVPVHSHRNHTASSDSGDSSVLYVSMSGSEFNTAQLLAESSHHSSATRNNNNSGNSSTNNAVLLRQDVTVLQVFILANMDTDNRSSSAASAAPDTVVASVVIFLTTPPSPPYAQNTVHPGSSSLLSFGLCSYVHRVVSVVASLVRNNYSTVYHIQQNSNRVNHKHAIVCEFNARLLAAIQDMQRELVVVTGAAPAKEQRGILKNTTAELSLLEQGIAVSDHIASLHDTVNVVVSSHFARLQQYSTSQAEVSLITNNYAFTIEQHNKLVSLYNWLLGALASTTPLLNASSESSSGSGSGGSNGRHYLSLALHPDVIDSTTEDVTGSGDINSAMHRQYLTSTALSEVALHNRLLAETLKLLGTDHQQYQHISSVLLPEILHNQNTTTLSTSDSPVLPEHISVVWRLDDLGTVGEGSTSAPNDHDSTVHIYSAAKLTECLASQETVVISGAELSHLLHYNSNSNNVNIGSNSGAASENKVNIPLPYGAHIACVTYKPILARSTGSSGSSGNGEGKEVVTAVVQYVTFGVSDSTHNNTINSSAVTATNTNTNAVNTAATTTRTVVEQILQCISQHSVDTWQTSGAAGASSDTHLMLSDAASTGANNALCNTAQYSALRSAMSSILNRHMLDSSVSGKVPHLLQNGSFLKHMSAITGQLAAAMLRSDASLFFPSEVDSAHGLQPGAVVSSHPYNTLSFSGVVYCSSGSDGRYVRSNSAVSQLNTGTYPALFSLIERLAINGNGGAAESEGVNFLSLCQGSILSQIIKGNSNSASGIKRYILICEIDASYHPLTFNNQSHGGAARATDNLLLLVELPHKPSTATLSIFQTIVSTMRAVVASYHYHFQLQAQHAELVGISKEFALTSSNLMHTAKELRLLSIVNKYVEQCCVCLSGGVAAAGSSETISAKAASPLTLSAFIRSATSTQRTTATATNNNTSVSSPRASSNASSHLLCEVFQSASRVELVAVNEAVLLAVRESLSSNTSVVSGADNRVYSPSKKNGDGNSSSSADSGSGVGGSSFYPSVQSASYYFGTKFLTTSGTAAVSNNLNSKIDRLAALCLAVNCVIVCDDSNSDNSIDAGVCSLFIPVIGSRSTVGADLKLENCGLAVHHSLLSPSLLNQHQTTANSNDGYALQVTFPTVAARAEYISVISSLGSAFARADSASSPKHNNASSIYPQLLQSLVTGMKSYIASHRSYSERILSGHSDVFTSDVSSITAKVLREVVALCSAARNDSSNKPTVTIQKVSAIVSHLFRDVANCKGSVLSYDAKVHWLNIANGGSETAGDAASPRPSASIFSEESDSDGDAADFEEQEEMKSPVVGTNRVSKFSTGRERSHDGVIGNRKYHNKWLTAVAMNVGNINNINSIGSTNAVSDTMGSADSDPSLQLMLLYSHFKVVPSTLTKEEIGAVLASAHGVFASQEIAGSNPLTSTNIRLLINVSVGDAQQAVLEVVLNCNREVHDHLSSRSSGSGGSVDVTLLDSALLVPRNVLHSLLLPAAPTFALMRHTYSQIMASALLQQQHSSDLNTLDGTIANKKQRITLLGKVLGILTSEGNRVGVLLQAVQDALRFLPHISKSVVSCRDVVTDSVIYEATMVYSADKHSSGSNQVNVNSSNVYSASTTSTPVTRNPTSSVSFVDAGHPTAHSQFSTPIVTPLDPNNHHPGSNLLISTDYKGLSGNNASGRKVFNQLSSPSVYRSTGLLTPSNKSNSNTNTGGDVVEYVFECYEIHGTLTVHIDNSDTGNATTATGRNVNNNLKTPAINTDANNANSSISSESHSVLQHITRALARRVFELHRGNKNKRLMAVKQEELQLRNYQLAQKDDKVESLEVSHSRTQQELQLTLSESDKLRHLMGTEVQSLKETLRQKKELTAHLRQSMIEQRRESDKKENALNKQITDLKENLRFLSAEKEKVGKEVKKSQQKERNIETSNTELSYKVADLQRQLTASQTATQTATAELERITAEYHAVSAREAALQQSEDSKLRILLAKVKGLDEELMTLRGTNSFLRKQLEATSVTLQTTQQQHATHVSSLQTKLSERDSAHRNADNNTQNLLSELHNTEQQLYVVSEQLKQEQQVVAEQRNKIALLEQERNKLIRGWKDVKSTII